MLFIRYSCCICIQHFFYSVGFEYLFVQETNLIRKLQKLSLDSKHFCLSYDEVRTCAMVQPDAVIAREGTANVLAEVVVLRCPSGTYVLPKDQMRFRAETLSVREQAVPCGLFNEYSSNGADSFFMPVKSGLNPDHLGSGLSDSTLLQCLIDYVDRIGASEVSMEFLSSTDESPLPNPSTLRENSEILLSVPEEENYVLNDNVEVSKHTNYGGQRAALSSVLLALSCLIGQSRVVG